MTWASFICLLAFSSAVFGGSNYGSYSNFAVFKPKPIVPRTWPVTDIPMRSVPLPTPNYGSYNRFEPRNLIADLPKAPTLPLSEADILCKGKTEGFVIVLLGGEKFIICTTDSKGDEFFCPKGLLYNEETKRCERKYNPNPNPCASQPCLNGGRCIPTQYSYQCECAQGYTGRICELDGSVCQQQQPCGQSFDSVCQSFHVGSALKHVCILQEGRVYGLTAQETFPNPCLTDEGIFPLGFGNKGFIMCDGEQMFVQSCPGETIWDSITKVCVWPEIHVFLDMPIKPQSGGLSGELEPTEVSIDKPLVEESRSATQFEPRARMSDDSQSSSGGGGGGGGGGGSNERFTEPSFRAASPLPPRSSAGLSPAADFTRRFTDGTFRPASSSTSRSSAELSPAADFTRRFTDGVFIPSGGISPGMRGKNGRPNGFPVAGLPGATSSRARETNEFDKRRRLLDDPLTDASIPIPFTPRPSNQGGDGGNFNTRGFVPGRPGERGRPGFPF